MAKAVSNPYGMDPGFRYMDTAEDGKAKAEDGEIRRTNTIVLFSVVFVLLVACVVFFLKVPT